MSKDSKIRKKGGAPKSGPQILFLNAWPRSFAPLYLTHTPIWPSWGVHGWRCYCSAYHTAQRTCRKAKITSGTLRSCCVFFVLHSSLPVMPKLYGSPPLGLHDLAADAFAELRSFASLPLKCPCVLRALHRRLMYRIWALSPLFKARPPTTMPARSTTASLCSPLLRRFVCK